jgi:hypothetical protein
MRRRAEMGVPREEVQYLGGEVAADAGHEMRGVELDLHEHVHHLDLHTGVNQKWRLKSRVRRGGGGVGYM